MRCVIVIAAALLGSASAFAQAPEAEAAAPATGDAPVVETPAAPAEGQAEAVSPEAPAPNAEPAKPAAPPPPPPPPSTLHLTPSTALSAPAPTDGKAVASSSETADATQASAIVTAFHQSLRENYRKGALAVLAPDVAIFEQGYTESSRDNYGGDHLDNDLLFAATTRYEVRHREAAASGDMAWVITQARVTGTFAGQEVDLDHTETAVLERRGGRWLIVHLHWSAHPRSAAP